jgi:lipoyl(octanoyl) transferase
MTMGWQTTDSTALEWRASGGQVAYPDALAFMEARVAAIRAGTAPETVWLLEHPPLYTAGTSAEPGDLLDAAGLPVYQAGRGGKFTWHGPGQRIAYVMLDLKRHGGDVRAFVCNLEDWMTATLARFGIRGERRPGRVGIWVDRGGGREDKIGAIGVRVRHWVTYHGASLNIDCDLTQFRGIVPCGISGPQFGVTSLRDLGVAAPMAAVDAALTATFTEVFGGAAAACAAPAAT